MLIVNFQKKSFQKLLKLRNSGRKKRIFFIQSELDSMHFEAGVKTILFAALSVEAAINDYAAWQLSDSYFDKHLSSLDVLSKWVVIPKLVCGQSIKKSGPAYSSLKKINYFKK